MDAYFAVKLLHIVSATLLFGTGLGTAFFMYRAWLANNPDAWRITVENVVLADWLFTTPAVIVQLLSGLWLTSRLDMAFGSLWFVIVIALFCLVGACWLPAVAIQIRLRDMAPARRPRDDMRALLRTWVALGIPAFISMLLLLALMVYRPWTDRILFG